MENWDFWFKTVYFTLPKIKSHSSWITIVLTIVYFKAEIKL